MSIQIIRGLKLLDLCFGFAFIALIKTVPVASPKSFPTKFPCALFQHKLREFHHVVKQQHNASDEGNSADEEAGRFSAKRG